ncbi:unnamed protein product [Euphydryas editha]|uniref:Secreted protein n=1 Tax=Euphydryas editha TaxID=104508 RepID=A0AAU9TV64_EUPED|nr:unnamed protein product [Euphydryas editha]
MSNSRHCYAVCALVLCVLRAVSGATGVGESARFVVGWRWRSEIGVISLGFDVDWDTLDSRIHSSSNKNMINDHGLS